MIQELKSQGTWRLFGLGIITFGTYYAHYCARQSRIINKYAGSRPIPPEFTTAVLIISYLSLALFLPYLLVDETHPVAIASDVVDKIWIVMIVIWGFLARDRVNTISAFGPGDPRRIHGVWTFLFTPLHFNYKINVLNQAANTVVGGN
jgi:hypothetical protein